MKFILLIVSILFTLTLSAQEWRDSLSVARSLYKKGEYSKASRYYQSAQKKAPEGIDFSDEMAQSAYKARDFEKAEQIYRQSAASKKDKKDKASSYHNLGNTRMKKKDYTGAVESYKEALRNNPNDEQTRYNLSEAIRRLKEEQKKEDQNKDQDQQNQQQNQDDQNNKDNQDKKDGDQKDKNQGQDKKDKNKQNQKPGDSKDKGNSKSNSSSLPNKSVERMLDQLMKSEAATKRKIGGSQNGSASTTSGKDW